MNIFQHLDKKTVIGFGVVIVILLAVFFYYLPLTGTGEQGQVTVLSTSPLNTALGQDLLAALAKLKSTKLDTSVFTDPVFASLKDFGVEIAAQPVGRRNPFAVFDGTKQTAGTSVKTPILPGGTAGKPVVKPVVTPPKTPVTGGGFDVE